MRKRGSERKGERKRELKGERGIESDQRERWRGREGKKGRKMGKVI